MRALQVHPDLPILASVGLDRFLRLHDTRTRQPLAKVYIKQQLTGDHSRLQECILGYRDFAMHPPS